MYNHPKTSYHPFILVAFHLNCLPSDILQHIPKSTQHDWRHKDISSLFGHDWYLQNIDLFNTLQHIAINQNLTKVNRALLRLIAINKFMKAHSFGIKEGGDKVKSVIVYNIQKVSAILSLKAALKCLRMNYDQYLQLRKKVRCATSIFNVCRIKHPTQLLQKEIAIIKSYCAEATFLNWPLSSVYHQIIRDNVAFFNISTFYKYAAFLNLKRRNAVSRRKNHYIGIRANAPLQILHADVTEFRTADNNKSYIYLVQDNFSRSILAYSLSKERKAQFVFENLTKVKEKYLLPAAIKECQLITDDGSENHGMVQEIVNRSDHPVIKHAIAQLDIEFSNSMIEAANKQLKYRFLYYKEIQNYEALQKYVKEAIEDFNNRPHHVLNGLTPVEVLDGKIFDLINYKKQITISKELRLNENRIIKCCSYTF